MFYVGERERLPAGDRASHRGEDGAQAALPEGRLPGRPEYNPDHSLRLLLREYQLTRIISS